MSAIDLFRMAVELLLVPTFGVIMSLQGRLSRIEGELKSLYTILDLLTNKKGNQNER